MNVDETVKEMDKQIAALVTEAQRATDDVDETEKLLRRKKLAMTQAERMLLSHQNYRDEYVAAQEAKNREATSGTPMMDKYAETMVGQPETSFYYFASWDEYKAFQQEFLLHAASIWKVRLDNMAPVTFSETDAPPGVRILTEFSTQWRWLKTNTTASPDLVRAAALEQAAVMVENNPTTPRHTTALRIRGLAHKSVARPDTSSCA